MNNDSPSEINENISDNVFLKSWKKITNSSEYSNKVYSSLDMINGKIVSKIDSSSESINDLTISNIGDKYSSYINSKKMNDNLFLVISDENDDAKVFSQIFASSLKSNNIKVFFLSHNESINLATSFSTINKSFGGVIAFSLSNSRKDILLINFFNNDGSLLSNYDSAMFNEYIAQTSELNLRAYDEQIEMLQPFDIDQYMSRLPEAQNLSNISVSINNSYNVSNEIVKTFFERNQIKYNQSNTRKPTKNKNIKKAIFNSIKNKSDVALSFLPGNNAFEIAIRHKKQYFFYDLNDLSAIYLYYQIKYLNKDANHFKDKYIVKNISASDLVSIIAKKNKILVKEYENFYSMLSLNKDLESQMILATNGTNYFISEGQSNYISDPIHNSQLFLEMISYFKNIKKSLYDIMLEISLEYGIFRHSSNKQNMDDVTSRKFFNIMSKTMKFDGQKIIRLSKVNDNNANFNTFKVQLEDKTKISFIHSKKTNSLVTHLSLHFKPPMSDNEPEVISLEKNKHYIDLIVREKKIIEAIKIFNDDYAKKNNSWKDFLKYFIFIVIFIGIFVILFSTLYNSGSGPLTIFQELNDLIKSNNFLMYMLPVLILMFMFPIICNAILIGRMLKVQGQKFKIRHLIIASSIGIVISNITPLSVGGDIASYWYFRRKSFDREPLIATFLATSFLYQVVGALISLIFIPMGLYLYEDIFLSGSALSSSILTFVLIGFFSNVIAALFIGIFSFSQKAQSFFIKSWIQLIGRNPLMISRDPSSQAASFQYAFIKIRSSSLMIFKNFWLASEFLFWRILPYFVSLGAILAMSTGFMKPNSELWGGQYLNFIICSSILSAANAISITPGGSGTSQLLQTQIFLVLFKETDSIKIEEVSKIFSLLSTILFFIIPTILSALLLFTVWLGEKRIDKYAKLKRVISYESLDIQNKNIRKYTRFYKISAVVWTIGLSTPVLIYYLSYAIMK